MGSSGAGASSRLVDSGIIARRGRAIRNADGRLVSIPQLDTEGGPLRTAQALDELHHFRSLVRPLCAVLLQMLGDGYGDLGGAVVRRSVHVAPADRPPLGVV